MALQQKVILMVEDDQALNQGIYFALGQIEYQILQAYSLEEARSLYQKNRLDLILVDINLPDGSGWDFLQEVRKESTVPILILTANDLELDIVTGFRLGADDYVTKPFSLIVLRARVEALLRRSLMQKKETTFYTWKDYQFDFDHFLYKKQGKEVILSKTEQKLLKELVFHANQTLSREQLVDTIWTDGGDYVDENALSVAISRLRNKLGAKEEIQTVYGIGYSWVTK